MKQILIDKFVVPSNTVEEFIQRMNYNRNFLKTIPGFINDSVYERREENGNLNIITIAIWENEAILNKAKELVQEEYKRIGFNPAEMIERLNITMERGIYKEIED